MVAKKNYNKERESEMAAIWGSEKVGEMQFPKRKGGSGKKLAVEENIDLNDALSDCGSDTTSAQGKEGGEVKKTRAQAKKEKSKKQREQYKLHCFIESGTSVNDVREVFEQYEPKVDLRTAQKGNLLNKVHYAVLTFRNKAMAMHAVKMLDGTNQRDLLGVGQLKLAMMLSRYQNKIARRKNRKALLRDLKEKKMKEVEDEDLFVKKFMESHGVAHK